MEKATLFDLHRISSTYCGKECRNAMCGGCPLGHTNNGLDVGCIELIFGHPKEANEIVLKWCKEHPAKTYWDDFCEKFPKTEYNKKDICRSRLYDCAGRCLYNFLGGKCEECWDEEYCEGENE